MNRSALAAALLASAFAFAAWGCEGVPDLTFADASVPTDAADAHADRDADADAFLDASADAGDAMADVDWGDGAEAGCPERPPPGASVCCGAVACEGLCAGQCDLCMVKCTTPGALCCAKNNNVVCQAPGSICH